MPYESVKCLPSAEAKFAVLWPEEKKRTRWARRVQGGLEGKGWMIMAPGGGNKRKRVGKAGRK